jgi:hypothetical protein
MTRAHGGPNARGARAGLMVCLVIASLLSFATPAQAYSPGCGSRSWSIPMHSSLGGHIADLHETATRCWSRRGYLTSSSVHYWVVKQFYGHFFGYQFPNSGTYRYSRSSHETQYAINFSVHPCVGITLITAFSWCGHTANFKVITTITAPRFQAWYNNGYYWGVPFCTNKWCHGHLSFGA